MKQSPENFQIRGARFEAAPTAITTVAGLRLLMAAAHHVKLTQAIRSHIKVKKIASGFGEEEFLLPLVCNLALGRCDLNDITELRQDKELTKLVFGRTKLPSERRLAEHLAAYKESDLAGLKRVNASLLEYLELLAEEPAGRIPLDFDSSCFEQYGPQKEQMGRHYSGQKIQPRFARKVVHVTAKSPCPLTLTVGDKEHEPKSYLQKLPWLFSHLGNKR